MVSRFRRAEFIAFVTLIATSGDNHTPETFDEAAAAAVWSLDEDAAREALDALDSYSNIEITKAADTGVLRYRLHDLARDFANARLSCFCASSNAFEVMPLTIIKLRSRATLAPHYIFKFTVTESVTSESSTARHEIVNVVAAVIACVAEPPDKEF